MQRLGKWSGTGFEDYLKPCLFLTDLSETSGTGWSDIQQETFTIFFICCGAELSDRRLRHLVTCSLEHKKNYLSRHTRSDIELIDL